MKARIRLCLMLMASVVAPAAASAATTFQVDTLPGTMFTLDTSVFSAASPIAITYLNVAGTYPRNDTPTATVSFFFAGAGGGFQIFDPIDNNTIFADLSGGQLFALMGSSARFTSGAYALFDNLGQTQVTVRITADPASAVPEPTSWILMTAGIGAAGGVMRRRRARRASMLPA